MCRLHQLHKKKDFPITSELFEVAEHKSLFLMLGLKKEEEGVVWGQ